MNRINNTLTRSLGRRSFFQCFLSFSANSQDHQHNHHASHQARKYSVNLLLIDTADGSASDSDRKIDLELLYLKCINLPPQKITLKYTPTHSDCAVAIARASISFGETSATGLTNTYSRTALIIDFFAIFL